MKDHGAQGPDDGTAAGRAESALRESEEKYRLLIEATSTGFVIIDDRGRVLDANEEYVRLTGRGSLAEVVGRAVLEWTAAHDRERNAAEIGTCQRGGSVRNLVIDYVGPDGRLTPVELNATVLQGPGPTRIFTVCRDVSERRGAEAALRESQRMLQTIIDTEPDCIKIVDAQSRIIMMNRSGLDMIQAESLEQVKGQVVCQRVAPEYQSLFMDLTGQVFQGRSGRLEFPIVGLRGRRLWLETHAVPLRNEKGEIIAMLGVTADITARRLANEELKRSETRYRMLYEDSPVMLHSIDAQGVLVSVSDHWLRTLGYSRQEVLGRRSTEFLDEDSRAHARDVVLPDFMRTGVCADVPYTFVKKSGERVATLLSAIAERDEAGKVVRSLAVIIDITKRKRAEEALRESEERFRDLADSLPLTVFEMDLQGRLTYVNHAALAEFGYSPQDFAAGLTMDQVLAAGDRARAREVIFSRMAGKKGGHVEYQGLRKDGTTFPITVASNLVLRDGRPVGVRGIVVDLSERKLLEEELLKSQKLESIGTLAGGIAHDFNNLLQGIFGYITIAKQTIDQREKSLAMLEQAEKALHQSVSLTSQLLTFSKGGKPLRKRLELRAVIENAVKFALSGSRVGYDLSLAEDLRAVDADEGQIGQVVQNIVLNAEQSMPSGGRIEIAARNVPLCGAGRLPIPAPEGLVEIEVRDRGAGIPPGHLPRIFDPYFTTKEKGSGLGLATSYSIVSNHDGTIDVSSEPGRGSVFTVYLPAARAVDAAAAPPAAAAGRAMGRKGKVLVMDDEQMVRVVAGELLRGLEQEVASAGDGAEAVEKYREALHEGKPFDVVILDLTVRGGMGGAEAARLLAQIDPGVRAVVSSGYSDDEVVATYRQHGFCAFLKKPYNLRELCKVLDDAML